jgi:hypothetical protein
LFGAWAAEEYGLIGSIEWVDQFKKILDQRAVIYINTDPGVIGSLLKLSTAASVCTFIDFALLQ